MLSGKMLGLWLALIAAIAVIVSAIVIYTCTVPR